MAQTIHKNEDTHLVHIGGRGEGPVVACKLSNAPQPGPVHLYLAQSPSYRCGIAYAPMRGVQYHSTIKDESWLYPHDIRRAHHYLPDIGRHGTTLELEF